MMILRRQRPTGSGGYVHRRIGAVDVSLRSDLSEVAEDFAALYDGGGEPEAETDRTIRMEVRRAGRSRLGRSIYVIRGDGQDIGRQRRREEVLPFLEWGINWRVILGREEFLQIHSATLAYRGCGFLFAGTSGAGKSTLAAALMARGWHYLCDELALIHPDTLCVHPFPKALCIKSGSFDLVRKMNLPFAGRRHYVKGLKGRVAYVNPLEAGVGTIATPVPVRFVIFPRYERGSAPGLFPISRARAVFMLACGALNRNVFGPRTVPILNKMTQDIQCYGLRTGSLDETCDLIESLVPDGA